MSLPRLTKRHLLRFRDLHTRFQAVIPKPSMETHGVLSHPLSPYFSTNLLQILRASSVGAGCVADPPRRTSVLSFGDAHAFSDQPPNSHTLPNSALSPHHSASPSALHPHHLTPYKSTNLIAQQSINSWRWPYPASPARAEGASLTVKQKWHPHSDLQIYEIKSRKSILFR